MFEVELRALIDKNKYDELLECFKDENVTTTKQITYYFSGEKDFRIMFMQDKIKLWLKEGKLHDDYRKEYEVLINISQKDALLGMLHSLGYEEKIKWFRVRNKLDYRNITLTIDYTEGYGYIFEGEILVENEKEISEAKEKINKLFEDFNVSITPKDEFNSLYSDYKNNWKKKTQNINENNFFE